MDKVKRAYLELHFSVFLWGFTAILGKLITLRELPLVWYRILITCVSLLLLPHMIKRLRQVPAKDVLQLAGIGVLVALHWLAFYGSIKYANVSVALSCLATTSFMTALIEPFYYRTKWKPYEIAIGLLIIPGIYLMFYFTKFYTEGIILGLAAAFFAAVFTVLNRKVVQYTDARSMTFIELAGGLAFLSIIAPVYLYFFPDTVLEPPFADWVYLVILAVVCTTLPFVLGLRVLRHLSAFAANLTVNLEPLYGIIMAIIFFQENKDMDNRFYIGSLIILLSVFIHPWLKKRFDKDLPVH